MTNSLSEQVAGLESHLKTLIDINADLVGENADLIAERDQLKADAMSDLIKRQRLETQVRNREAERDDLQRQVQEARDENERLRDLVDVLGKHVTIPSEHIRFKGMTDIRYKDPDDDFPCCDKPTGYADDDHKDAEATQQQESEPETVAAEDGIKGIFTTLLKAKKTEDERAQKVRDAWQTAFAEVYLGQDDDVTHADTRLTVHDLEVAPVGSVVDAGGARFTKNRHGDWINSYPQTGHIPHEIISITSDATATLTTPEAQ